MVYTPNPSYAMSIITKSLKLNAGDEILTTDLEYGAMDKSWNYYCKQTGVKYVRQPINLPLTTKEAFVEDFLKALLKTRPFLLVK
ncbi:MAG: hypothetical protein IPL10_05305 [Bacteroidetes bacterium]|nr:hypothetical protein [Bacteroidota bacterium]